MSVCAHAKEHKKDIVDILSEKLDGLYEYMEELGRSKPRAMNELIDYYEEMGKGFIRLANTLQELENERHKMVAYCNEKNIASKILENDNIELENEPTTEEDFEDK